MAQYIYYGSHTRGDTIDEKEFQVQIEAGGLIIPVDLTGCDINCEFLNECYKKQLSTDDGITLSDAVNGKFIINEFTLDYPGIWYFDIQITFPNGEVKTYIKGRVIIENDKTK